MIWTGAAWSYASLLGARMVLGAWDPCDNPTSQSLIADYYPKVQRSKVMSVYQAGQLLGILLVPIAAAMATDVGMAVGVLLPQHPGVHRRDPRPPPARAGAWPAGPDAAAVSTPASASRRGTTRCRGVRPTASSSAVRTFALLAVSSRNRRAVLREHRHVVTDVLRPLPRHVGRAGRPPRSACSPSADSPACCSPAGWPTT